MNIIRAETENLAKAAAEKWNQVVRAEFGNQILLFLSGGSAFEMLPYMNADFLGTNTALAMIDDRYSTDPKVNNFLQLSETPFFKKALNRGAEVLNSSVLDGETVEAMTDRIETVIAYWRKDTRGKMIAILGLGADGHTAGQLPYPENPALFRELFEGERAIVGYDAGAKSEHSKRVTATGSFLRSIISETIVFVKGENKKAALQKVLAETGTTAETPGRVFKEMKDLSLFTDIVL